MTQHRASLAELVYPESLSANIGEDFKGYISFPPDANHLFTGISVKSIPNTHGKLYFIFTILTPLTQNIGQKMDIHQLCVLFRETVDKLYMVRK